MKELLKHLKHKNALVHMQALPAASTVVGICTVYSNATVARALVDDGRNGTSIVLAFSHGKISIQNEMMISRPR